MLAKSRAADADIDRNIEDRALEHGHKLALRLRVLNVQAAEDIAGRAREIVLDECR